MSYSVILLLQNMLLNNKNIEVSELTLLASFRYALGRQTYIVSEVVENILKNWAYLSEKFKINIKEEIQEAIKNKSAGSDIDIEQWNIILAKDMNSNKSELI